MGQGNVVLLNRTSSAGKSSIARALQEAMVAPYLHTGIDHFLSSVPKGFSAVSDGARPATHDYFLLVYRGATARSIAAVQRGEEAYPDGALAEVRIGPGRADAAGGDVPRHRCPRRGRGRRHR